MNNIEHKHKKIRDLATFLNKFLQRQCLSKSILKENEFEVLRRICLRRGTPQYRVILRDKYIQR